MKQLHHFLLSGLSYRLCLLACVAAAIAGQTQAKEPDRQAKTFDTLVTYVSRLVDDGDKYAPEWQKNVALVRDQLEDLQTQIGDVQLGDAYIDTLSADGELLKKAAADAGTPIAIQWLQYAHGDLSAKTLSAKASLSFTGQKAGMLTVRVSTTKDGNVINGFLVRANMVGNPNADPPYTVFSNPSSPTEAVMPPGMYVLFVRRTDQAQALVQQYMSLYGTEDTPVEISVAVP